MLSRKDFLYYLGLSGALLGLNHPLLAASSKMLGILKTSRENDLSIIRSRLQSLLSDNPPSRQTINRFLASMKSNGSWDHINYKSLRISSWPPQRHLTQYVYPMAKAYTNPGHPLYHNPKLRDALHHSLNFWLDHNFTSRNWWYNDIGIPKTLCEIMIMLYDEISMKQLLKALNQMRGSEIAQTGQNKVWRAEIQVMIGLLTADKGRTNLLTNYKLAIIHGREVLSSELHLTNEEGIQPDWSFQQHGPQLQFGNYGLSFAMEESKWSWIFRDTHFALESDKIGIMRNYILKGLCWDVWKGQMDISGLGRQIFPGSATSKGKSVIRICQRMKETDPDFSDQYQFAVRTLTNNNNPPEFLLGNRYYYRSALAIHRRQKYCATLRMCSEQVHSTESGNGENLKGAHLADGATYIYRTGNEYDNIFPIWDWHHIPGVTSYSDKKLLKVSWKGLQNGNNFVGGVSDGTHGAAVMFFDRDGLRAKKSWFFLDKGVVFLGTEIDSGKYHKVATTLNQSLKQGNIIYHIDQDDQVTQSAGEIHEKNIRYVHHDKIGYLFLGNYEVGIGANQQTGSWNQIYSTGSKKPITNQVFNLWIDHGTQPQNKQYAYMIIPDIKVDKLTSMANQPEISIIQNSSSYQVLKSGKDHKVFAVFYEPEQLRIDEKLSIIPDAPCMMIIQDESTKMTVTLSDPLQKKNTIQLTLSGRYSGKYCTYDASQNHSVLTFKMPEDMYAGKSIQMVVNKI